MSLTRLSSVIVQLEAVPNPWVGGYCIETVRVFFSATFGKCVEIKETCFQSINHLFWSIISFVRIKHFFLRQI
jgi:hypothetical protein